MLNFDADKRVGDSLVQIWKLKFVQTLSTRFGQDLKLKLRQDLMLEFGQFFAADVL